MNTLCFLSNLTSAELAAWVQAIGSIVAIMGSVFVAHWQTNKQHKNALEQLTVDRRQAKKEVAMTLAKLARNCSKLGLFVAAKLMDRDSIHEAADDTATFERRELARMEQTISGIPLHELPNSLIGNAMVLGAAIREYRYQVELAISEWRKMDSSAFDSFFLSVKGMNETMATLSTEIEMEASVI